MVTKNKTTLILSALSIFTATLLIAQTDLETNAQAVQPLMSITQAAILGLVEGITEFLPVSSTGHLILADAYLGLRNPQHSPEQLEAIEAFEIVIQGGAILAVLYMYLGRVRQMILGVAGRNEEGRKLFVNIMAAFIPTAVIGLLLNKIIKHYLQQEWPTVFALAVGGIAMILFERSQLAKERRAHGGSLASLSVKAAVVIGLLQCVAMWPGTSRSMMTILAGMLVGLSPIAAAEFSFLLGVPTLLAATAFKAYKHGPELIAHIGIDAMAVGLVVAAVSAFFCVKGLIHWLTKNGLTPFGWYRIGLAVVVAGYLWNQ